MVSIDGNSIQISDVVSVSRKFENVEISLKGKKQILASNERLNHIISNDKPVYGINTGFGIFCDKKINRSDSELLSRNLILSHAVGTGDNLSEDIVRAAMLIRANTLAKGYSGVRLEVVETLVKMLNASIFPLIPSQGSLGSSGDLCQLSHLALILSKDNQDDISESGYARFNGEVLSGRDAMEKAGIPRIVLGPKEGLGLNNGATFSAAIGALAVSDSEYLIHLANVALSLSLEALLGCSPAFCEKIHELRAHPGQLIVAKEVNALTEGSQFLDAGNRVQDAYSLRCSPQVHGAVWDTINHCRGVINHEINAATDNPLILDENSVVSGGNFHGEPVGMVMDFLGIAMAELGAISERRIFRLVDGTLNGGLPPMLVNSIKDAGVNSGLMMLQYTAASLVLENQTLASPDSVHSLPTSSNQEDHNANSMTAARHARMIVNNVKHIIATEIFTAIRAIHLRKSADNLKLGKGTSKVFRKISDKIEYSPRDAYWLPGIEKIKTLMDNQSI